MALPGFSVPGSLSLSAPSSATAESGAILASPWSLALGGGDAGDSSASANLDQNAANPQHAPASLALGGGQDNLAFILLAGVALIAAVKIFKG